MRGQFLAAIDRESLSTNVNMVSEGSDWLLVGRRWQIGAFVNWA